MEKDELANPWWLLPPGRLHPVWWVVVGAGMVWIDYVGGPGSQFPVFYVIPVALAAWYSGRGAGVALALAVPAAHLIFQVMTRTNQVTSRRWRRPWGRRSFAAL